MRVSLVDRIGAFALLRGEAHVTAPVSFIETSGVSPRDIIGTGHAALFLVSERFVAVLRGQPFTGWSTFGVLITRKDGSRVEGYYGFTVTGRCGALDFSKSESMILPPRTPRGQSVAGRRGMYFEPSSWDGSDIFCPLNTGHVLVLESVRNAIRGAHLTNVALERASEIESIVT